MSQAQCQLPWLDPLWLRLIRQVEQKRLPHALLLSGIKGLGKTALAERLAGYLLCHRPNAEGPCGDCKQCNLVLSENHPDKLTLLREGDASAIKVDQIRGLTNKVMQTSQQGGDKVIIIPNAEMMNTAAANAFLKMLEEPPPTTYFVLTTSNKGRLIPTIRSRCQQLECFPPSMEEGTHWLCEQSNCSREEAKEILGLAHLAPLLALELFESQVLAQLAELNQMLARLGRGEMDPIKAAAGLVKDGLSQRLEWLQYSVEGEIQSGLGLRNDGLNQKCTYINKLYLYLDRLREAGARLASGSNLNELLLAEDLMIEYAKLRV